MSLKGVIFDHDGTLVDSEKMHFHIWREFLKEYSIDFSEEEYILHHSGVPSLDNANTIIQTYGIDTTAGRLSEEKEARTFEYFRNNEAPLMPFAEESIEKSLTLGLKLGIATGASRQTIERSLAHRQWFGHISAVATSDDVSNTKPAPDVYLLALKTLSLQPCDAVAVEDSRTGVSAAKAAGLTCIAVANEYSQSQDLSDADYQVEDLFDAMAIIEKL